MQIKKDDIRKVILEVATEEFLEKGYKKTSMRTIARKANVGLSNIYNYFKNKNEILGEVLTPLMKEFEELIKGHNRPDYISTEIFTSEEYQLEHTKLLSQLVLNFKEELNLLLFKSHGSQYENFWDEFTDKQTVVGMEYMQKMKEKYPHINVNISEFFIHTMSSWWLTIIGELVSHDLDENETEQFFREYVAFGTAGWKMIMQV
jgi:AcrR family transcriptional regulator